MPLLSSRRFDPDELEHAHVAWYIAHGAVPFRDFFEHHTPLFHYALASFFWLADPDRLPGRTLTVLFEARYLTWAVSAAVLVAMFVLARQVRDATTAWVSLPLAAGSIVMALRAIEIRPDGLSTLLWLLALIAWVAALAGHDPASRRTRRLFALSGASVGLGVLTSQKLLLAGPPMALMAAWYVAAARFGGARRDRLANVAWQAAGAVVVSALAVVYFAAHGAASEFVRLTLLQNLAWKPETTAGAVLAFIARYEPWLFPLTALGATLLVAETIGFRRPPDERPTGAGVLLLLMGAGLFIGLFVVPVPYPQYCLTFIPLFAIVAAAGLVESARSLSAARTLRDLRPTGLGLLAAALFAGLSAVDLRIARPLLIAWMVYPALVIAAIAALLSLPLHRRQDIALSVALIVLSALPLQWSRWMLSLGDGGQFDEIRYVEAHTPVNGTVLDGWSGAGVFRRHSNYYWMFHPGVRAMVPPAAVAGLVQDLRSGRMDPDVVILDRDLRELSPDVGPLVRRRYVPGGPADVYVRASP